MFGFGEENSLKIHIYFEIQVWLLVKSWGSMFGFEARMLSKVRIVQSLDNLQFSIESNIDQRSSNNSENLNFELSFPIIILSCSWSMIDFVHSESLTQKKITLFLELEKILHLKPPLNLDSCNIIVGNNFSIQDDPHMWGPYPSIILKTYEVKRLLCAHTLGQNHEKCMEIGIEKCNN